MRPLPKLLLLASLLVQAPAGRTDTDVYDFVIEGGRVVDGTGAPARRADVGITGGRIASVGDLHTATAARRIDARGLVVTPGFIDVHSHADEDVIHPQYRAAPAMISQGVTTAVFGVDGYLHLKSFRELKRRLAADGVGVNFALYIGHNDLRAQAFGMADRAATSGEMGQMKAQVLAAMKEGALGLSTGLMYLPGKYASTDEVVDLARVTEPFGGRFDSHDRDPAFNLLNSVDEVLTIGRRAGVAAHVAHLKAVGLQNFGASSKLITHIDAARANGEPVTCDVYPYDGATTRRVAEVLVPPHGSRLEALLARVDDPATPSADLARILEEVVVQWREILAQPEGRAAVRAMTESPPSGVFSWVKTVGYGSFRIVRTTDAALNSRMVVDVAHAQHRDPFDLLAELLQQQGAGIKLTLGAMREDEVRALLRQSWAMVSSDGREGGLEGGRGHPRYRGSFARVLSEYVRNTGLLTLEEAVHKMTGLSADYLRLPDRGILREGAAADIAVFDPAAIRDLSTWDDPSPYATGMSYVLVNGKVALEHGQRTQVLAGRFLPMGGG